MKPKSPFYFSMLLVRIMSVALPLFSPCGAVAQAPPLSIGSLQDPVVYTGLDSSGTCPSGFLPQMTCYQTKVTACQGADPLSLIFGFAPAANAKGLVVFFNGEGGTSPDGFNSADANFASSTWERAIALSKPSGWPIGST